MCVEVVQLSETIICVWFITAYDADERSSRVEEQCQEIEQEHRPEWSKPCCPCSGFCANLFLYGIPLVQNV